MALGLPNKTREATVYVRKDIITMLGLSSDDPVLRLLVVQEEGEQGIPEDTGGSTQCLDPIPLVVLLEDKLHGQRVVRYGLRTFLMATVMDIRTWGAAAPSGKAKSCLGSKLRSSTRKRPIERLSATEVMT